MTKRKNPHIGQSLEDWLQEEGISDEVRGTAIKRVLAWQLREAMEAEKISKSEMARRMHTSRAQLNRLLDPDKEGVLLETLQKAAAAVGRRLEINLLAAE